jgi:8-oxo-dGTP pyrophosphatase MutT (NUDIX family)
MDRVGWGVRHPALARILGSTAPAAVMETAWRNGELPLRIAAYTPMAEVPDDLVVSVRCIVRVEEDIVVCWDRDGGVIPGPGGRREGNETFVETACREVREETGWLLEPESLRALGWLHFEHLNQLPPDHPWPHPDFVLLVYVGRATQREGGKEGKWVDTEGYVVGCRRMSLPSAQRALSGDQVALAFLALVGS